MLHSFVPLVRHDSQLIVLGTMPGVVSLQKQEYYGHPRNAFWRIVYGLFGEQPPVDYRERCHFLLAHGMALWDVLAGCDRTGSLDSNIQNDRPNDFSWLFSTYPQLRYVVFNGGKAEQLFKKHVGFDVVSQVVFMRLPSTSPTHTLSVAKKGEAWMGIRNYLGQEQTK